MHIAHTSIRSETEARVERLCLIWLSKADSNISTAGKNWMGTEKSKPSEYAIRNTCTDIQTMFHTRACDALVGAFVTATGNEDGSAFVMEP